MTTFRVLLRITVIELVQCKDMYVHDCTSGVDDHDRKNGQISVTLSHCTASVSLRMCNAESSLLSVYSMYTQCILSVYSVYTQCILSVYSVYTQ